MYMHNACRCNIVIHGCDCYVLSYIQAAAYAAPLGEPSNSDHVPLVIMLLACTDALPGPPAPESSVA